MSPVYRGTTPGRVFVGTQLAKSVYRGVVEIWRRDHTYLDTSGTVVVPTYAAFADVGVLGGGGGGATGDNGVSTANGEGGFAATWATQTIAVTPGATLTFSLGSGGAGASGGTKRSGSTGGASTVTGPGLNLTSNGGAPGIGTSANRDSTGSAAQGVTTGNGATFPAGSTVGADTDNNTIGSGGGGGSYPGWFGAVRPGKNGGPGAGRIRWRSY